MKNAPMRFCGYTLRHNPAKLKIDHQANIRTLTSPCCSAQSLHFGNRARTVSGEGELVGTDCIDQFRELEKLHSGAACGLLSLPRMKPITAFLKELSMIAEPVENALSYRFVFIEARPQDCRSSFAKYYITADSGESLWDIGFHTGVGIDALVALNPQIRDIDRLKAGEKVKLC